MRTAGAMAAHERRSVQAAREAKETAARAAAVEESPAMTKGIPDPIQMAREAAVNPLLTKEKQSKAGFPPCWCCWPFAGSLFIVIFHFSRDS